MPRARHAVRRLISSMAVVATAAAGMTVFAVSNAPSASAATPPIVSRNQATATADPLPTVQVNGVVWSLKAYGDRVYAGGEFSSARPAGAPVGTSESSRVNLLAFSLSTGELISSFTPRPGGRVNAVALSPDGKVLYVGGNFASSSGVPRYRIAAYNTSNGTLVSTFVPQVNAPVNAIVVTRSAVYIGGYFSSVNGVKRSRLAALNPVNGAVAGWSADANADVDSMTVTPDGSRIIVGGKFTTLKGAPANGMGSLSASTGAVQPWAINKVVRQGSSSSSVLDLYADTTTVYGTAYSFGVGNFEGTFAADPSTGNIKWLADTHGDSYGVFANNAAVYSVSHTHFAKNIGGFPEQNPRTFTRASAFTKSPNGTVSQNSQPGGHYADFVNRPAPSIYNWFPNFTIGTFTGQSQAAWSITGSTNFVVAGGEFPKVNGKAQQGLVRFAIPSVSPHLVRPELSGSAWATPTLAPSGSGVKVLVKTNWDRDDQVLSYAIYRSGTLVKTIPKTSQFWNRPTVTYTDTSVAPSRSYTYSVRAIDSNGNFQTSGSAKITSPAAVQPNAQAQAAPPAAESAEPTSSEVPPPTVEEPVAAVDFTAEVAGLTVTAAAISPVDDGTGTTTYAWDFGDGQVAIGSTAEHAYAAPGDYAVTLTVTDAAGQTTVTTKDVSVLG